MKFATVNGVRLAYEDEGQEGPTLLFVHGANLSSDLWREQIDYFKSYCRVIAVDVRGHGESQVTEEPYSIKLFAQDLNALLEHLKVEEAIVCGLSMGGMIAQQLAIDFPRRVQSLILAETLCSMKLNVFEQVVSNFTKLAVRYLPVSVRAKIAASQWGNVNKEVGAYLYNEMMKYEQKNLVNIWKAVLSFESRPYLKDIKCPTLVLAGANNWMFQRQAKTMAREIPNAKLYQLPQASHLANMDNPKAFNKQVHKFVQEGFSK
ncbi:pimeloyl-ACP methyl ester carboxylesterase [Desulfitispora alkaliphila]|uniref:alpha/beta fold hydrolase n=1 Tax=Desulfitispora alkaliphila TaxID=622674 RepID=UPI003D19AF86